MTNPQQQYTEMIKQAQDAMLAALQTWTRTFQQALDDLPGAAPVNRERVIDQGFDFVGKLVNAQLDAQRQLAKAVQTSAEQMTEALRGGSVL
jgi:hypothetical protein